MDDPLNNSHIQQPLSVDEAYKQAFSHFEAQRYTDADKLCTAILQVYPNYIAVINLLGLIAQKLNRHDLAVELFQRAISIDNNMALLYYNLATSLCPLGRIKEAIKVLHTALEKQPENSQITNYLNTLINNNKTISKNGSVPSSAKKALTKGISSHKIGRLDEAINWYNKSLEINPENEVALLNIGLALQTTGKLDEAVIYYQKSIFVNHNYPEAYFNLGNGLKELGKLDEAVNNYQYAIALSPNYADAYFNLGNVLKEQCKLAHAVINYQKAIAIKPDYAVVHLNLGVVFKEQGNREQAIICYQKAITCNPEYADAYSNLGAALQEQGNLEEAVNCYKKAIAIKPNYAAAYSNLGTALQEQGNLDEAVICYKKALTIKPYYTVACSNLLFCSQYIPNQNQNNLFLLHRKYGESCFNAITSQNFSYKNNNSPNRRIHIGLVSPDLGLHPVGHFMMGFLKYHSVNELEITCYSDKKPDEMTNLLKSYSDNWVSSRTMGDDDLAQLINNDCIDILIDLAGHTVNNRLNMFIKKPAPVQISWAGYVGTTGLQAIDYIIADKFNVPENDDKFYTERIIRLPDSWLTYTPSLNTPKDTPRIIVEGSKERFTLGNFGNPLKINEEMLQVWSQILLKLPNADLLFIYKGMDKPDNVKRITQYFERAGVKKDRIIIEGYLPHQEFLTRYNSVDIALDTLPYSGGITIIEALWMGVPVVTTYGDTFAGRHAASILHAVGLAELVTKNFDEYIQLVVHLVTNHQKLNRLKKGLRNKVTQSPFCDHQKFSINVTKELRKVWVEWCKKNKQ
ncbi:MAG: tetratricopeptide repeat protein [Magnetococcales bacterium]|nr:tetratricopeptide repeat protein [Magnetococcales bacterium]